MTRKQVGLVALVVLALFCGFVFDLHHQNGIVHSTRKNGYGCLCHGFDPNDSVRVWISGPDSLQPGEVAEYWIHVAKRSSIAAGFNVASYRGSLGVVDSIGTQLMTESPGIDSLELTHKYPPRPANGRDTISWVFSFTAPPTVGFVDTLYAVGNSVDLDVTPDGDRWNFAQNFPVRVVRPTSVGDAAPPLAFTLLQNYPNPFNPSTTIRFQIPGLGAQSAGTLRKDQFVPSERSEVGRVTLKVYDVVGREIATLVDEPKEMGEHTVIFDGSNLPSGVYLYQLTSGGATQSRKMLLMR